MFCIASTGMDRASIDCSTVDALLVMSQAEFVQFHPFAMDTASAVQIGSSMLLVWAVAAIFRAVVRLVANSGGGGHDTE